jgi:hypothetical protein
LGTTTLATDSGFESELMATPSRLVEAPAVPSNSPDTGSQPLTEIGAGASPTDWFEPVPITPVSGQTVLEHLCIYRFAIEEMRKGDRAPEAAQSVRAHIDTAPHVTRWAYLEYLDILAASKKRNDFEAVRQRFRNRFNQMGPYWMESREEDKGLKPEALAEVAALWPGAGVRALLTHWLLGDEASSRHAFSLACYDDIFTLYELHSVLDQPDTAAGYLSTGAGGL